MAAKDYANTRFSGLEEINAGNVRNLRLAWNFSTGVLRGHEGAPLIVKDTMYFVTPHRSPNMLVSEGANPGVTADTLMYGRGDNASKAPSRVMCMTVRSSAAMPVALRAFRISGPPPNTEIQRRADNKKVTCSAIQTAVLSRAAAWNTGVCQIHTTASSTREAISAENTAGARRTGSSEVPAIPHAISGAATATTLMCTAMCA